MNEPDVRTLLEEVAHQAPAPDLLATVRERAAEVRRRRRVATVGLTAIATAAVVSVLVIPQLDGNRDAPATPAGPSTPTVPSSPATTLPTPRRTGPAPTAAPLDPMVVQQKWSPDRLAELPWRQTSLPRFIEGSGSGLAAPAPIRFAVAAAEEAGTGGTGVLILGDDGRWRRLDVTLLQARDAGGYSSPALQSTSLSADGTHLALPQPHLLVVVDLTSGKARRYDVPGFPKYVAWSPDGDHVLVGSEERTHAVLVDASNGSVTRTPYSSTAGFAPDGTVVEESDSDILRVFAGDSLIHRVQMSVDNQAGALNPAPQVTDGLLAVLHGGSGYSPPRGAAEWGGIVVCDLESGDPLAMLPVHDFGTLFETHILGWLESETLLVQFPQPWKSGEPEQILAWDYSRGQLSRVSEATPGITVSVAVDRLQRSP